MRAQTAPAAVRRHRKSQQARQQRLRANYDSAAAAETAPEKTVSFFEEPGDGASVVSSRRPTTHLPALDPSVSPEAVSARQKRPAQASAALACRRALSPSHPLLFPFAPVTSRRLDRRREHCVSGLAPQNLSMLQHFSKQSQDIAEA